MARFRYMGEVPRPYIKQYGPCRALRLPMKGGVTLLVYPPEGEVFHIGQDIGLEVTDERTLRFLRSDLRFLEIPGGV